MRLYEVVGQVILKLKKMCFVLGDLVYVVSSFVIISLWLSVFCVFVAFRRGDWSVRMIFSLLYSLVYFCRRDVVSMSKTLHPHAEN